MKELGKNKIVTSKYNWLNFIPFNLALQFSKVANIYFLVSVKTETSLRALSCFVLCQFRGDRNDVFEF